MNKEIQKIIDDLSKHMSGKRLRHSIGVMYTAGCLAMRYGTSTDDAYLAGILHDCAKEYDDDKLISICRKNNLGMTDYEKSNPFLLHGKAGAYVAEEKYGIKSPDILGPIIFHTTGRAGMTLPEQILFVADYIEPNRKMIDGLGHIRHTAFIDIDKTCALIIENCIKYLNGKGCVDMGADTLETYEYYKKYM